MNPGLSKSYDVATAGTILPRRIVKFGATDHSVVQSAVLGEGGIGVSDELGDVPGGRADIWRSGLVEVVYGGNVTRGAFLTNDTQGRAIVAAGNQTVIGVAEFAGVANDIGKMLIYPSRPVA